MHRKTVASLLAMTLLCMAACASFRESNPFDFDRAPLFGMIYDDDNSACPGVAVSVDGKEPLRSDINGRFVLSELARGTHTIELACEDHERLRLTFEFQSRSQVLYLKMISFNQLISRSQEALEGAEWAQARRLIDRASALRPADPVPGYLRAILAFRTHSYAEAERCLSALINRGTDDPYVYRFLADLYESYLERPEAAMRALEAYLERVGDPVAEERLARLRAGMTAQ